MTTDKQVMKKTACQVIFDRRQEIVNSYMALCRKKIPEARELPYSILKDTLDKYLDEIADVLRQKLPCDKFEYTSFIGKQHGEERARFTAFSVSDVLREYSLLREVLFDMLNREAEFSESEAKTIQDLLEVAAWRAAEHFLEVKRALREDEFRRSERALVKKTEALEQFAAKAAHDLRSPLSTICGFLELLHHEAEQSMSEAAKTYIAASGRSAAHLVNMVDSLLEFTRSTVLPPDRREVRPSEILQIVAGDLKMELEEHEASIHYRELPVVGADPELLARVFQNLITNAVKFRRPDAAPRIDILAKKVGDVVQFEVRDNGQGFAADDSEKIFQLFRSQRSAQNTGGLGLGLATCRGIVEAHGGVMWARSVTGEGASFFFTLPCGEPRPDARSGQ